MDTYNVICMDGKIRHEPFPSIEDAQEWAEWGHICLAGHKIQPKVKEVS